MKQVEVVAAAIIQGGKVFCARRPDKGSSETAKKWEFPGGKIEKGETHLQALEREIREELDTVICAGSLVASVEYTYAAFSIILHVYFAEILTGSLTLKEHLESRWLAPSELDSLDWAPADIPVLKKLQEQLK